MTRVRTIWSTLTIFACLAQLDSGLLAYVQDDYDTTSISPGAILFDVIDYGLTSYYSTTTGIYFGGTTNLYLAPIQSNLTLKIHVGRG